MDDIAYDIDAFARRPQTPLVSHTISDTVGRPTVKDESLEEFLLYSSRMKSEYDEEIENDELHKRYCENVAEVGKLLEATKKKYGHREWYSDYCASAEKFYLWLKLYKDSWVNVEGGKLIDSNERYVKSFRAINRFHPVYSKGIMRKFYNLERFVDNKSLPCVMMTLTSFQDKKYSIKKKGHAVSPEESIEALKEGWQKLRKILRKYIPDLEYIGSIEPHESMYCHFHIIIFNVVPEKLQRRIKRLWEDTYNIGSRERGVYFGLKKSKSEEAIMKKEDIGIDFSEGRDKINLVSYLIGYIRKTFVSTCSKYESGLGWTEQDLLFNALIHKNHYRRYFCSQGVSKIIKRYDKFDNPDFDYDLDFDIEDEMVWEQGKICCWIQRYPRQIIECG